MRSSYEKIATVVLHNVSVVPTIDNYIDNSCAVLKIRVAISLRLATEEVS